MVGFRPVVVSAPSLDGLAPGDQELIERCAAGDRQAFDQLYDRHVDFVYRCLIRLVGPQAPLEDLLQTVFLAVFRSLPNFRGTSRFRTWLYRVTANIAFQHLRRPEPAPFRTEWAMAVPTTPEDSPEARVMAEQDLARACQFLDRLKPKFRIAFLLRVVEELSLKEISEIVGASVPTVGARVRKAEQQLQRLAAKADHRLGATTGRGS